MSVPQKIVLLACGSFNPITNMHLRMFELARDSLNKTGRFRVVGGIISPVNDGYKKQDLVHAKHRTAMIKLALKSSDWIRVDTWESEQEGWTETAKVLRHHKEALESTYNANPLPDTPTKKRKLDANMSPADEVEYTSSFNMNEGPPQLRLLCGADLLESFAVPGLWKDQDIEEIVGRYGIVCITRASATHPEKFIYESDVLTLHRENIQIVTEWIQNEISSTKIRRALHRSESVKYLLQDSVIDYIKSHSLYSALDNRYPGQMYPRTPSPSNHPDCDLETMSMPPADRSPTFITFLSPREVFRGRQQGHHPMLPHQPRSYHDNRDALLVGRSLSLDNDVRHPNYRSQSLDNDSRQRGYRRHRDLNYDEEHKRREIRKNSSSESLLESRPRSRSDYRKTDSMDSVDSQRGRQNSFPSRENSVDSVDYNKKRLGYRREDSNESVESQKNRSYRRDDSFDSLDSERSTSRSPNRPVTCMGMADISGLVRRVRGMRVTVTPETCV